MMLAYDDLGTSLRKPELFWPELRNTGASRAPNVAGEPANLAKRIRSQVGLDDMVLSSFEVLFHSLPLASRQDR